MGDQVQQRQFVEPQTDLHQHEPHLGAGGPGETHLDTDTGEHDQPGDHCREAADHHQEPLRGNRERKQFSQSYEDKPADIDNPRVQ